MDRITDISGVRDALHCLQAVRPSFRFAIAKPIKKGRAGSNQGKDDAAPLAPARSANSGDIQHNDVAIAAIIPTPVFKQMLK